MPRRTYPVSEQARHKPAAQLFSKADYPVLCSRVDFEVEPFGYLEILDQRLTFRLDVGTDGLSEFDIPDKGLSRSHMVGADGVDNVLSLHDETILDFRIARSCCNSLQPAEYL